MTELFQGFTVYKQSSGVINVVNIINLICYPYVKTGSKKCVSAICTKI